MFGKLLLLFLSVWALACAKPNYQDEIPHAAINEKAGATCDESGHVCVRITWETEPSVANASFVFEMNRDGDSEVLGGEPFVKLWMRGMNHGSSPVTVEKISNGQYRATRVNFIMPGEWEIQFQIKNNGDVQSEIIQKITIR